MWVSVHIYPHPGPLSQEVLDNNNNDGLFIGVHGDTEEASKSNNPPLSVDERMALLNELADKFMEFVGPDFPPLSDYAMSREGIYEDHP